eukprot:gb/GECG01010564.1/.p1 GENE.gb/GECG01010564.1/~~gb/GECG01010564.1/.p1  ORF type:complete len:230 (+),score=32.21 gb/GECG01010564.1/:1-690(+)
MVLVDFMGIYHLLLRLKMASSNPYDRDLERRRQRQAEMTAKAREGNERLRESLRTLQETEAMAQSTSEELANQRDTLHRIKGNVEDMDYQQDRAHYHLKRMNGVWSRIGSWFKGGPKKPESSQQTTHEGVQPSRLRSTDSRRTRSTESRERRSNDDYEHSNTEVGQMLSSQDRYLEEIEGSVDNLAQRGKGIRDEIEYQNQVVDDVGCKIDNVERRMEKNTKEARRLMR